MLQQICSAMPFLADFDACDNWLVEKVENKPLQLIPTAKHKRTKTCPDFGRLKTNG